MAQNDRNVLEREELRAILALGVIGSLIALNSTLHNLELLYNLSLHTLLMALQVYWGTYVFLTAIGISGRDLIKPRLAKHALVFAEMAFVFGIGTVFATPVSLLVDWLILPWNLSVEITYVIVLCIQIAMGAVIADKISNDELKEAIGESYRDLFPNC